MLTEIKKYEEAYLREFKTIYTIDECLEFAEKYANDARQNSIDLYVLFFDGIKKYYERDYNKAKEFFENTLKIDQDFSLSLNMLGNVYYVLRDFDRAIEHYQKSINVNGTFAYPWIGLGNVYNYQKKFEKAAEYFMKAIEIDDNLPNPFNGLANVYYGLEDYNKALEYCNKAINVCDKYPQVWCTMGNVYIKLKNYNTAIEHYQKSINLDPKYSLPWNGLGISYYQLKEYNKSIDNYLKAIYLRDDNPGIYRNIALSYSAIKKYDKALKYYQESLEIYNDNKDNYWSSIVKKELNTTIENLRLINKKESLTDPIIKILNNTEEMEEKVFENKKLFSDFIKEKHTSQKEDKAYFEVLRRWNSYTPIIADNYHISKGGGYFIKTPEKGIVIDPGFNFIDNFKGSGHFFYEIDIVLISHAHNDHTADVESILTLLHKYNQEIKGIDNYHDENTIRSEIANGRNIDIDAVSEKDIDDEFNKSGRKKIIDFYLTLSVFKKLSGLFDLYSNNYYNLHIIHENDSVQIDNYLLEVLGAKHNDIISDRHSVGFALDFKHTLLIYTGDTGWNSYIEKQYIKIAEKYGDRVKLLVAHIGGFKEKEKNYKIDKENFFYKNHLGRIGLAMINKTLNPKVCFISEFGEELKGFRIKLANIYNEAFKNKVIFFPADIGLNFNLIDGKIKSITKINVSYVSLDSIRKLENYTLEFDYIHINQVNYCELKKDYSLHYYDNKGDFSESDVIQVLADNYENSIR